MTQEEWTLPVLRWDSGGRQAGLFHTSAPQKGPVSVAAFRVGVIGRPSLAGHIPALISLRLP